MYILRPIDRFQHDSLLDRLQNFLNLSPVFRKLVSVDLVSCPCGIEVKKSTKISIVFL